MFYNFFNEFVTCNKSTESANIARQQSSHVKGVANSWINIILFIKHHLSFSRVCVLRLLHKIQLNFSCVLDIWYFFLPSYIYCICSDAIAWWSWNSVNRHKQNNFHWDAISDGGVAIKKWLLITKIFPVNSQNSMGKLICNCNNFDDESRRLLKCLIASHLQGIWKKKTCNASRTSINHRLQL